MSKLVSIAALTYLVSDPVKTAEFYESLGFLVTKKEPDVSGIRLNWFTVEFHKSGSPQVGDGQATLVNVDDVDEFYKDITAKGIKAETEPQDSPFGRREFTVKDPDGYKLVFFKKK